MAAPKKYGLIIPKSKQQAVKKPLAKPSAAFGGDSDDDDDTPASTKAAINRSLFKESGKKASNKSAQIIMSRALEEDPSVYQYDEVYDKMTTDRHCVAEQKKTKDRKPKYINQLLKNAAARKLDDERRLERQAHREREKEGDEFHDKDAFITPSFLKKQAELRAAEEATRKREEAEAKNDVTQKDNLNDFYRNLLSRKTSVGSKWSELPEDKDSTDTSKKSATTDTSMPPPSHDDAHKDYADKADDADDKDDEDDDKGSERDEPASDAESSADDEEIQAAMELVKSKADREAEEILARKRAVEALRQKRAAETDPSAEGAAKLDRRNTETSISSARERYLQRKREQAAKAGQ